MPLSGIQLFHIDTTQGDCLSRLLIVCFSYQTQSLPLHRLLAIAGRYLDCGNGDQHPAFQWQLRQIVFDKE